MNMNTNQAQDRKEIEQLFEKLKWAWGKGDGKAYGHALPSTRTMLLFKASICREERRSPMCIRSCGMEY